MLTVILTTEKTIKDVSIPEMVEILGTDAQEFWPWPDNDLIVLAKGGVVEEKYKWTIQNKVFYGPLIVTKGDVFDFANYQDLAQEDIDFIAANLKFDI